MSTLFYSQVNRALQQELVARGSAGTTNRTTTALNYMLGKIANVELKAFEKKPTAESTPIGGFGVLGGLTVLGGSYMPSGENGFLNSSVRPSYRIPPVITSLNISINDQSKNYINKASITISIPDATTDMDEMEQIYCAPGRYVQIKIAHPETAVITGNRLDEVGLPTTKTIRSFYPNIDLESLRNMNELYFQGRISTFSYSYNTDGSVELTIEAIGTSNTYAEIQVNMKNSSKATNEGTEPVNEVAGLYTELSKLVENTINDFRKANNGPVEFEIVNANTTDQSILVGTPYSVGNSNSPAQERMVTLGYLINFINQFALEKLESRIICDDSACTSNFYERLVSANPIDILLRTGTTGIKTDVYTYNLKTIPDGLFVSKLTMFPEVPAKTLGFAIRGSEIDQAFPSRIYINLNVIKKIQEEVLTPGPNGKSDSSIRNFLIKLSQVIRKNTGNAINMALVQDPVIADALLYYDVNLVNSNASVTEFTLPVFATKTGASVVREFTLSSNVPDSVKNMIFGISSADAGTQKQVAYNPYIYADEDTRSRLAEEWKTNYQNAVVDLETKKNNFAKRPADSENNTQLQSSIERYVTYFTPDIKESIRINKSIFPMELQFTIDGINGFKYGDVLSFAGLPKRYTDSFVFCVTSIAHSVSNDGEWTTQISCIPRIRIK